MRIYGPWVFFYIIELDAAAEATPKKVVEDERARRSGPTGEEVTEA